MEQRLDKSPLATMQVTLGSQQSITAQRVDRVINHTFAEEARVLNQDLMREPRRGKNVDRVSAYIDGDYFTAAAK